MATTQTANVYITNTTDGTAQIALSHQNDSNGAQSGSWSAEPGQTVGPLLVVFETGIGSYGILDWWTVTMTVSNGSQPGIYQNTGTSAFPHWKECQLQHQDAGADLVFTVGTSQFATNLKSGGCTDGMARLANYSPITNVFVLMLENRSFDHMFGSSGIPGLTVPPTGTENSYNGTAYPVASPAPPSMTSDPGHEFADTVEQLAGPGATYPQGGPYPPITMTGFAANYATVSDEDVPAPSPDHVGDIMLEFDTPTQLPTSYALATSFAVCDHWYSSMPGPTWPNRMFVHGASSAGLDHTPSTPEILEWESVHGFAFPHGSIYDALNSANLKWRIYNDNTDAYSDNPQNGSAFGAVPQVTALKGVTLLDVNSLTHFAADLQGPYPYQYTFIEPNYGDITANTYVGGSSQHPMDDVYGGEGLIKAVAHEPAHHHLRRARWLLRPPPARPSHAAERRQRLRPQRHALPVRPLRRPGACDCRVPPHRGRRRRPHRLRPLVRARHRRATLRRAGSDPARRGGERRPRPAHVDSPPHRLPADHPRSGGGRPQATADRRGPSGRRFPTVGRVRQRRGLPRSSAQGRVRDLRDHAGGARATRCRVRGDPDPGGCPRLRCTGRGQG
jgi:hypothetical protein